MSGQHQQSGVGIINLVADLALEMDESDTNNNAIGFTVLASFLSLSLYVCVRMYVWRRLVATDWVALVGLLTPLDP